MAKKIKGRPRSADPCGTASIRTPAVEIRHAAGYLAYILCNWVKYDAKLVRSRNERIRSTAICKAMKQKHGLTFSEGKENVKIEKLHRPDKVKYTVYEAVKTVLEGYTSLTELAERLTGKEIVTAFVHRGGDPQKEIQGITFTKDNLTFKASKIDRKFSYANLCKTIERNRFVANTAAGVTEQAGIDGYGTSEYLRQQEQPANMPAPEPITEIRGRKLTPEQQRQLYSPQGLTYCYEENGCRNTSRFRVNRTFQWDILTEERLSTKKIDRNPVMFGIRLTDEQVEQIRDGQPVYLEGMRYENRIFDGYLVMDDKLTHGWAYVGRAPNEWVKYGKYTMRRMDRDLIERGYTVHALVQWWGGHGPTASPYLWKENPSDEIYKED